MRNSRFNFKNKINRTRVVCCTACNSKIQTGDAHDYHGKTLCEDCIIDIKMRPKRRTHWQYLRSIQSDYIRPGRSRC